MKLKELELLHMLMSLGSVTGAAKSLHMSQPNASKMLKKIENDFGFSLFDRQNGRLYPTEEAQLLVDQVERTLLSMKRFHDLTEDIRDLRKGSLIIGSLPLLSRHWLPKVVADFMAEHQDITITFHTRSSKKLISWVSEGQVDIALGLLTTDDPNIIQTPFIELQFVAAIPRCHSLAKKITIQISDFQEQDFISLSYLDQFRNDTEELLSKHRTTPRIRAECSLPTSALQLVEKGVGITVIDHLSARFHPAENIVFRRFSPTTKRTIWLMQPKTRARSRITQRFIQTLEKAALSAQLSMPTKILLD